MKRFYPVLGLFVILLALATAFHFGRSYLNNTNNGIPNSTEAKVGTECIRTARLDNDPQYDRALSIIAQRLEANNGNEYISDKFTFFPETLTNCIKVIEKDISDTGTEGYFTFHSKDIKPNYFPITVDRGYYFTDDVLIALLLSHEITHVQQYIDSINGKDKLSCIDKEVDAFIAQLDFYVTLNMGENSSVYERMQKDTGDLHPQLQMIKTMTTINRESGCEYGDDFGRACRYDNLRSKLKEMISEDEHYKQQCEA